MKFCYCDETGTGTEPFAVMVGVLVDSQRMHLTKEHWAKLLDGLSSTIGRPIQELHTRDFYAGNGVWRDLKGLARAKIITDVCRWLAERKHHLVYTALNKARFREQIDAGKIPEEIRTVWRFMGFHMMLSVQKALQRSDGTKGNTVFIFDNENREEKKFASLIASPPGWSDSYYKKRKKQRALDQIVDVPYFGDSKEVVLIQLADLLAYFLRRYIEIKEGAVPPRYPAKTKRLEHGLMK